jgi:hypothetical protein
MKGQPRNEQPGNEQREFDFGAEEQVQEAPSQSPSVPAEKPQETEGPRKFFPEDMCGYCNKPFDGTEFCKYCARHHK